MKFVRIKKICPFCPNNKSAYVFKTYHGLEKHVFRCHLLDETRRGWPKDLGKEPSFIRVYTVKYSKFHDIPINGVAHVEAIIREYCKKFNPSLRGINGR